MNEEPPRKRGRPARPTTNAMGQYLRSLREERGLTVRELARAVGLSDSAASYVSQLEAGAKAPSSELARQLAEVLRDRQGVFRLWAMTSPRANDPRTAAMALRELSRLLGDPSIAPDSLFDDWRRARIEHAREALAARRIDPPLESERRIVPAMARRVNRADAGDHLGADVARLGTPEHSTVRLPLLDEDELQQLAHEGTLRADLERGRNWMPWRFRGERPTLRLEPEAARSLPLEGAFAVRIGRGLRERATHLLHEGDIAVLSREVLPLVPQDLYLVHSHEQRRVLLSLVLHNGRELLLLPDHGRSDFEVLPAAGPGELQNLLLGHVARIVRYPS